MYGKYTENVMYDVLNFLSVAMYGEEKVTLQCRKKQSPHVSWTLEYTRLSFVHFEPVKLLC